MSKLKERIAFHPFFEGMGPDQLHTLTQGAKEATFDKDEIIFQEGEPANRFFLVQTGKVALEAHRPVGVTRQVETVGAGEVFGWSWLFPPFVWHLQARALEPTTAIVLDGAHLLVASEENPLFAYQLMKRVSQIVVHRLQVTRDQLLERDPRAHTDY